MKKDIKSSMMQRGSIANMTVIGLMTALICILGPLSIQIGPIPLSLTNFAVYITVFLLGKKKGTIAYCLYLLIGMVGLPVFSGFSGGLAKMLGPTGGFLIGMALMAWIGGIILEKTNRKTIPAILGWEIANIVNYLIGTVWFVFLMNTSFVYAFSICVVPFMVGDLIKVVIGTIIGSQIRSRLLKVLPL